MGTIAGHRYPFAVCNARFSGEKRIEIDGPRISIARKLPPEGLTMATTVERPRTRSNIKLYELDGLRGFMESPDVPPYGIFLEHTEEGPVLYLFSEKGPEICDKSMLPEDKFVRIKRELAEEYHLNPRLYDDTFTMVKAGSLDSGSGVTFLHVERGWLDHPQATFFFPVSGVYVYWTILSFGFGSHTLELIEPNEAKDAVKEKKIVYSADLGFAYGRNIALEKGFMNGADEYFVVLPHYDRLRLPNRYFLRVEQDGRVEARSK